MLQLYARFVCLRAAHSLRATLAPAQQPIAAREASRDLTYVRITVSFVSVPASEAVTAMVVVIKQAHTIVQITEERA